MPLVTGILPSQLEILSTGQLQTYFETRLDDIKLYGLIHSGRRDSDT